MRILTVHNYYVQPGGEDTAFEAERDLLRSHGHQLSEYVDSNTRIGSSRRLSLAMDAVWSRASYHKIMTLIQRDRPDIAHFHNTFPLISPAAYYACRRAGIPVVQSLHNPRLMCPAGSFYRAGKLCTDCLGRIPWPGVLHACYHRSAAQTLAIASMLVAHRFVGTWRMAVTRYIVFTEIYRELYARGGLPREKLMIKPNFVASDPGSQPADQKGEYALFVGRLDPEKGIRTLLRAWGTLQIPLKVRGNGQLESEARRYVRQHDLDRIQFVDRMPAESLRALMRGARFLVWPSEGYYETFGLAAVESFAAGVPVLASGIGVAREIVADGETGLLFNAGDSADLSTKARRLWDDVDESKRMGVNARREYELKYKPERNYQMLMDIYSQAISEAER